MKKFKQPNKGKKARTIASKGRGYKKFNSSSPYGFNHDERSVKTDADYCRVCFMEQSHHRTVWRPADTYNRDGTLKAPGQGTLVYQKAIVSSKQISRGRVSRRKIRKMENLKRGILPNGCKGLV